MRTWGGLFTMIAATCLPTMVHAQATASHLPNAAAEVSTRDVSPLDRARQTMNDYGVCLVKSRMVAVQRALALPVKEDADRTLVALAGPDCLGAGELRMPVALMRGAVYRGLYLRDFRKGAPKTPSAGVAGFVDGDPLMTFAKCVNEADPGNVRKLVMADPATGVERTAVAALAPALGRCIDPRQQVRVSRATLQALLSEAAYRAAATSNVVSK